MNQPAVTIEHFTDPACPFAFSAEPTRLRAMWHYGEQLEWRTRLIVLADTTEELEQRGFTPQKLAAAFGKLQHKYGMPISDEVRPRLQSTRLACTWLAGVRRHEPAAFEPALRQLRRLTMEGALLDEESTLELAARAVGLDVAESVAWSGDETARAELEADWRAARQPGPASSGPLDHKLSAWSGGRRYSAPSWIIRAAGGAPSPAQSVIEVPGMQPFDAYEIALAAVAPTLQRRAAPEDVTEVLRWADEIGVGPLATAEVAALLGVELDDAREQLAASHADFERAGLDGYWSLARVHAAP